MISLGLGQKAVAATTVAVAAVAIAGVSTGTPVAVDEVDTQPDSPLYGLEKAGETIKEATYAGGQSWNLSRAEERVQEYKNMAEQGKGKKFDGLPKQAAGRLSKAAKSADSESGLERAQKAIQKHIAVLENVKEEVPEVAKPAVTLAIEQSTRSYGVLENIALKGGLVPGEKLSKPLKDNLKEQLGGVKENVSAHRKSVQEKLKEDVPVENILDEIENKTPKLGGKIGGPGTENKPSGGEEVSASGVLEKKPEVTSFMYGTHALVGSENQELIYALESANINLDAFVAESVDIEGTKVHSGLEGGPPLVNVEKIDIIQGESEGEENQQEGPGSSPFEPENNQTGAMNPT